MPSAAQDTVIRLALLMMAREPTSPLTFRQRRWAHRLKRRQRPFSAAERAKVRGPLLAWLHQARPGCYAIVARQFLEGA